MAKADPTPEAAGEGARPFVKVPKGIATMDDDAILAFAYKLVDAIAAALPASAHGDEGEPDRARHS